MTKKFTFSVIALAVAVSPFLSVNADNGNWDAAISEAAWNYGDYRVERLAFSGDAEGPFNLGDYTVVAEPSDSCKPNDCGLYDVAFLKNGFKMTVPNVPSEALDSQRLASQGGAFVFVSQIDWEGDHYAVTSYETDGDSSVLVEDVFFTGVEDIDVLVDGDDVYFNTALDFTGDTLTRQAAVYVWNAPANQAEIIGKHYELRDEQLLDAEDGKVLIKMEFDSGNKQLWIGNTENVNYLGMTREAIAGTWVEPEADIYAGHFVDADTIEFFMNYVRHTYDISAAVLTRHDGQYLNWFRTAEDGYQLNGAYMAWVDPSDTLFLSNGTTVKTVGTATGGRFLLEQDRVFYASGSEGKMYDIETGMTTDIPFIVTDSNGDDVVVGQDAAGNVQYWNMTTGAAYELGYGSVPVLADDMHVYWQGVDGNVYEGTVALPSVSTGTARAMKVADDNTVYLIMDGTASVIPSEKTYFTWFPSWDSVETVSSATLALYADGGTASFAPGTKVKFANDPKVYVVGDDGKMHWVMTETVAYAIFGSTWNKSILTITEQDMVTNAFGSSVESENDLQTI